MACMHDRHARLSRFIYLLTSCAAVHEVGARAVCMTGRTHCQRSVGGETEPPQQGRSVIYLEQTFIFILEKPKHEISTHGKEAQPCGRQTYFLDFNTFVVLKAADACKSLSSITTES